MIERFIKSVELFEWPQNAGPEIAAELREGLSRTAARRMTRLGLLCTRVLRGMPGSPDTAVVYATSMSEVCNLENYLESFPDPSPTAFQASIHPAGAQQALIALKRPIREFYPLCGRETLFDQALQTCFQSEAPEVVLVAGEERGSWLLDLGLAGERSFAFALHLSLCRQGAQAVVWRNNTTEESTPPALPLDHVYDRLIAGGNWKMSCHSGGYWEWLWL